MLILFVVFVFGFLGEHLGWCKKIVCLDLIISALLDGLDVLIKVFFFG